MVWPPQNTGLFEFKIPCCECSVGCYSVSGTNLSANCNQDNTVYPPAPVVGWPTSPYAYVNSSFAVPVSPTGGGPNVNVIFKTACTFTWVDDCDGTTKVTLTSVSVTSTDPNCGSISGVTVFGTGSCAPFTTAGTNATFSGCFNGLSGTLAISFNFTTPLAVGTYFGSDDGVDPSQIAGIGMSAGDVAALLDLILFGSVTGYPVDSPPDCSSGFVKQTFCPNQISFHYFYNQYTFTGLTNGSQYCVKVEYEWQPLAGGAWSPLGSVCYSFTATGTTETTGPINIDAGAVLAANPGGANYRVKSGYPTLSLDPTGSICSTC